MTTFAILLLVTIVTVSAGMAIRRWITDDGGPNPTPQPYHRTNWHPTLPTRRHGPLAQ